MASNATKRVVPLSVSYDDLVNKTNVEGILATLREAYGYSGLGLVTVSGVPGLAQLRAAALPKAYQFAHLDDSVKSQYVDEDSFFSFGWSHGKEKLEGKPDLKKGSFYFNPSYDRPVEDEDLIKKYPSYCRPNIWPKESDCAGFEVAAKGIAKLILDVGQLLAPFIDILAHSDDPSYPKEHLTNIISRGKAHKARLLYYFPADSSDSDSVSSWCGFHNDHGSLTGLCPSMYFDPEGKQIPCPDNVAGLYICTRLKEVVLAAVPGDHLAFQIGESAQIHSGGILQATPHAVKASATHGVSRATLAVFMQPQWDVPMDIPEGAKTDEGKERLERGARGELLPPGVPPLLSRWKEGQNFGEFTTATLNAYY